MTKQEESDGMAEQALNRFSHHTGEKPVVLIVDDSRVVRVSLRNILKDDCLLIEAENGDEAWQHLCENPSIEIVFSDLSMPKLDGRGLLHKVRSAESNHLADLPFIIVTGNEANSGITQELESLGATGVVSKPFDPSLITSFVSNLSAQLSEDELSDSPEREPQTDFLDNTVDRTQFMEIASRELSFAIRNKNELALALVHIDQFSEILEHYSEPAVEHILLAMYDIIRLRIHPDDTLAYFGGGRFAILRPASNAIGTRYLGRRILEDLSAKHFYLGESDQAVSASIGISAPSIKPGTLLRDLLLLAEGRLTAAMDIGGGKVIDKGNENLTPVSTTQDSSELSNIISNHTTDTIHPSLHSPTEIHRLASEQVTEIKEKYTQSQEQTSQIAGYQQALEELTTENRNLINEVEHWKKQSSAAEPLRRQLFEVESQHQQIKLKFNELSETNDTLVKRSEEVEQENRRLIDEEEARTASLRQGHDFIEEENRHLESQIQALTSRAEKAELESLKLNQLVSSLRENGNLLHMQLDQLQQQLDEAQAAQQTSLKRVNESSHLQEENSQLQTDSTMLNNIYKSELALSAMPEIPAPDSKPVSIEPFPEKDQITEKPKATPHPKIPPFHVEPEPIFFKNGFSPSSFQIASIILGGLLLLGFIKLYLYMGEEPNLETDGISQTIPLTKPPVSEPVRLHKPLTTPATKQIPRNKPVRQENDATETAISEEQRLKKELTLRQMAEEEFSRKLDTPPAPQSELPIQDVLSILPATHSAPSIAPENAVTGSNSVDATPPPEGDQQPERTP